MNLQKITKIFETFQINNPSPATELIFHNHFELLIAVILSARTTDISVNKATKKLFSIANTPKKMLALGENELKSHIKTIGLFNSKAKNIIKTCAILIDQYQSQIPSTREELEKLPGVGRKTAHVILNTVFQQPVIAVDTHIFRVAHRIGLAKGKTPRSVEAELEKIIPKRFVKNAHHWLLLHGRYICIARKPKCNMCSIQQWCEYKEKNIYCRFS